MQLLLLKQRAETLLTPTQHLRIVVLQQLAVAVNQPDEARLTHSDLLGILKRELLDFVDCAYSLAPHTRSGVLAQLLE